MSPKPDLFVLLISVGLTTLDSLTMRVLGMELESSPLADQEGDPELLPDPEELPLPLLLLEDPDALLVVARQSLEGPELSSTSDSDTSDSLLAGIGMGVIKLPGVS